ncbi:MAG TPA: hypothetical protein VGF50_01300 [Caulobacteraceae bacterium]|jgi:hypothetical protein
MTVRRMTLLTATAALALAASQGAALAHTRHHHHYYFHHARYAGWYGRDVAAVEYPYGGRRVMRSSPVPDTPYNRARFGGPMSYSGRMTAPIGD